eukprot:4151942-Pleurochrysis_carterae.AAC.2
MTSFVILAPLHTTTHPVSLSFCNFATRLCQVSVGPRTLSQNGTFDYADRCARGRMIHSARMAADSEFTRPWRGRRLANEIRLCCA